MGSDVDRGAWLGRMGERKKLDVQVRVELPPIRRLFKNHPRLYDAVARDLSVSGALLQVPAEAGIGPGQQLSVRHAERCVAVRVVRVAPAEDPDWSLVGVSSLDDVQWSELLAPFIAGPEAPTGRRWLGSLE